MKNLKMIALMLLLCLCVTGCAQTKNDPMEACSEALTALAAQEEVRFLSTTLIGETEDTMESMGTWEYWFSGEDKLVIVPAGGEDELWTLYRDGQCFKTMPENGCRVWEAVQEEPKDDSWVPPEVDIGEYQVKTRKDPDGRRTITLTGDRIAEEEGSYGMETTSGYRVEYVLNADGTFASYSLYYNTAFTDADGERKTAYWCMVMEYPTFEAGEITAHLNSLYEEATE